MIRALLLALAVTASALVGVPSASAEPVTDWGYLSLSDGVRLRYTVVKPSAEGRFPVALIWSVYSDGVGATGGYPPAESPVIAQALLDAGYAVLGVNMRGTGCSGGHWDLFQPASDGYEVVEWAAAQDWSTGDIGMFGFSAPGLSQLLTAATKPPHLRAITPADVSTDFYRDVAYPGGIANATFVGFWTLGSRPGHSPISMPYAAEQGDPECAIEIASREPGLGEDFANLVSHPYDDEVWEHYSPARILGEVDVPILTCHAWQDDQVTGRPAFWIDDVDAPAWAVLTNGPHGTCDDYTTPYTDLVVRFFDRFVRGEPNDFEAEPRVQVWHETVHDDEDGRNVPSWVSTHPSWPVEVEPYPLYFRSGGVLDVSPPAVPEAPDRYAAPLPASNMESNEYAPSNAGWKVPQTPGGYVAYTSGALTEDVEVFGPGSVDLWLASTAPDLDLQVTLSEIRPDGQETYVGRGWLRASHRALDSGRSTDLRPWHTHREAHAEPLDTLTPTPMRVELRPIGHVFRAGSAIRIYVESPTGQTGLAGFAVHPIPAGNQVFHQPGMTSRLVLGRVPGATAAAPLPACDTLQSQPCRPVVAG